MSYSNGHEKIEKKSGYKEAKGVITDFVSCILHRVYWNDKDFLI